MDASRAARAAERQSDRDERLICSMIESHKAAAKGMRARLGITDSAPLRKHELTAEALEGWMERENEDKRARAAFTRALDALEESGILRPAQVNGVTALLIGAFNSALRGN